MESKDGGNGDQERLSRFLAWRRLSKHAPAPGTGLRSYVAPVAWLGIGLLTVSFVANALTASRRPGTGDAESSVDPSPSAFPAQLRLASLPGPKGFRDMGVVRADAPARSERSGPSRRLSRSAATNIRPRPMAPAAESRLTTTLLTVRGWVRAMPRVRPGRALVRWTQSPPPATSQWPMEPKSPEAR
jgi:hypothetical protein